MILDTSAAVAMLRAEPEAEAFLAVIQAADTVRMSTASVLELSMVTAASGPQIVDDLLEGFAIQVVAVDAEHLRWARHAHQHFGRGSGSAARLNFGDCFAYAAARVLNEPLLFKGDDFGHTDVQAAVA
ncbi:type II toxin-antitoxin system VapC family toxin [Blastococcus sp. Marseille-P5729]|uniref:type II toxin-antitoxin system VapC family toxin n=1 Tax=Blastococcus sp. Marseille-P5729 TaxID=2086582 RepID=UPI000D10EBCA|nr:type II toxin-antitoxin system VapC family toxin [Blastococcus sp. Marseille-P5729]